MEGILGRIFLTSKFKSMTKETKFKWFKEGN